MDKKAINPKGKNIYENNSHLNLEEVIYLEPTNFSLNENILKIVRKNKDQKSQLKPAEDEKVKRFVQNISNIYNPLNSTEGDLVNETLEVYDSKSKNLFESMNITKINILYHKNMIQKINHFRTKSI